MNAPDKPENKRSRMFFLRQYLRSPMGIGAVAPSSQKLAQLMVESLRLQPDDVVIELGPGTGVFTHELLLSGVEPHRLILIEFDPEFAAYLRKEFPGVRIVEGDACALPKLLQALGQGPVRRVVSGIPLRSMKPSVRRQIALAVSAILQPGGILVQFSYLNGSPISRAVADEADLVGQRAGITVGNMPPAFVWKYVKAV